MSRDLVAAIGELVPEQLGKRIVSELRLLKADDIRPPLIQPGQKPRHALLQRVDVPGGDAHDPRQHRVARMSTGAAIAVGAVTGLALGIIVSLATDVPLAPEVGLVLGALAGWLAGRDRGQTPG